MKKLLAMMWLFATSACAQYIGPLNPSSITTPVSVANGGTGITVATASSIPVITTSGTYTFNSLFQYDNTNSSLVLGGGAAGLNEPASQTAKPLFEIKNNPLNNGQNIQQFNMKTYGSSPGTVNDMHFYRYGGSEASPTTTQSGLIASFGWRVYDGTNTTESCIAQEMELTQNANLGQGSRIYWMVTPNNSSPSSRRTALMLDQDGAAKFGASQQSSFLTGGQLVVNGTSLIGSELFSAQASGSRSFTWDGSLLYQIAGTLGDVQFPVKRTSATLASSRSTPTFLDYSNYITAGSSSQPIYGTYFDLNAGYTGSSQTYAAMYDNNIAGTGNTLQFNTNAGLVVGNIGVGGRSYNTNTGLNMGVMGEADGGNLNIALYGNATVTKNSATNGGVVGLARNAGTSPIQFGGYFGLNSSTPTFTTAAIVGDNGAVAADILCLRDNGTTVFEVVDGGGVTMATAKPLSIASGTNTRAGNATLVGGTVTVSNTTVTANTIVIITRKTAGGSVGNMTYTLSAGSSFTVTSDSGTDTSTFSYLLIENP